MDISIIIILAISAISIAGFSQPELVYRYQFNAWQIKHRKEYVRFISHGFFHGSWMHLIFNMFVLFSFGQAVLSYFQRDLPGNSGLLFLVFFLSAILFSSLYSFGKEKDNYNYNAIGASGAVSAIVYANILFNPFGTMGIILIPFEFYNIIFGVLYLIYSYYMAKRNVDNIGHDAHFWGAVYGFVFPVLFKPSLLREFVEEVFNFL